MAVVNGVGASEHFPVKWKYRVHLEYVRERERGNENGRIAECKEAKPRLNGYSQHGHSLRGILRNKYSAQK